MKQGLIVYLVGSEPLPEALNLEDAGRALAEMAGSSLETWLEQAGRRDFEPIELPVESNAPVVLADASDERFGVDALRVPHGPVPALAFRLRLGDATVVFASDQNGGNPAFVDFARDAELLVMHMPIPPEADEVARKLHATPRRIGEIAQAAGAKALLLSHFMARSLANLDENVGIVRAHYGGSVIVAEDLACVPLG